MNKAEKYLDKKVRYFESIVRVEKIEDKDVLTSYYKFMDEAERAAINGRLLKSLIYWKSARESILKHLMDDTDSFEECKDQ